MTVLLEALHNILVQSIKLLQASKEIMDRGGLGLTEAQVHYYLACYLLGDMELPEHLQIMKDAVAIGAEKACKAQAIIELYKECCELTLEVGAELEAYVSSLELRREIEEVDGKED